MPNEAFDEVPYGQCVAGDCAHLADNVAEMDVLAVIHEKLVAGWRPGAIAEELNSTGKRTRAGSLWTSSAVFDLLPRLIELSPRLQKRPDWPARRTNVEIPRSR